MQRFNPQLFRERLDEMRRNMREVERDFPSLVMDPDMINPVVAVLADAIIALREDVCSGKDNKITSIISSMGH
jgi:hypothetical protein